MNLVRDKVEVLSCKDIYQEDGRRSLFDLLSKYLELENFGWQAEIIATQADGLPIFAFKTPLKKNHPVKSLWILGGVHGEEPAGPNAFYSQLEIIKEIGKHGIPIVFIPLMNPSGYYRDWRYENEKRDFHKGLSVTDFEPLLLNEIKKSSRSNTFSSQTASQISGWVKDTVGIYQPELVFDHHEDRVPKKFPKGDPRNITSCYVYSYGQGEKVLNIAKEINKIFIESDMPVVKNGTTRFGEKIVDGVVANSPDGSIDEFLSVSQFFDPKKQTIKSKHSAQAVFVIETTIPYDDSINLSKRQKAHENIIKSYSHFWNMISL
ncbi:MAG TPA: hypothetical protein VLH94_01950 [Spirochaetia bacterium]|nr:hypothetical protein [Spirochaetia bacterium]